jgi:hypothetical protein
MRTLALALLIAASAAVVQAAYPVGFVRSSEPFRLRGATVPAAGTRWWPVLEGDDIVAGEAPAAIVFMDGTRVALAARSRVTIEPDAGRTRVRLLDGELEYELGRSPKVDIFNRDVRQPGVSGASKTAPGTER